VATLRTPEKLRDLQRALYLRAKKEPKFRAYALYDKVYRRDVLAHAYALARANRGAPGPDGKTFEEIDADGAAAMLEELREELKTKKYRIRSAETVSDRAGRRRYSSAAWDERRERSGESESGGGARVD
jgi:hypothetical protein